MNINKLVVSVLIALSFLVMMPSVVQAQSSLQGVDPAIRGAVGDLFPPQGIDRSGNAISNYVATARNTILFFGLVLVLGYIVYGGIKWISAGGDPKATQSAQATITHAIIGLILLALSFAFAVLFDRFLNGGNGASTGGGLGPFVGVGEYCVVGNPNFACRNPIHACVDNRCECADPATCNVGNR